jgi:hypothetical protein
LVGKSHGETLLKSPFPLQVFGKEDGLCNKYHMASIAGTFAVYDARDMSSGNRIDVKDAS